MALRTKLAAFTLLLCIFAVRATHAQQAQPATSPRTISYQGVISAINADGKAGPMAGERAITVSLYSDETGTARLWQSTMTVTIGDNGVFSVLLGTPDNPLPEATALDRPIWLGVAIGDSPELRPLSQITATAYALNVADGAISTSKLSDNAVTAAKLADRAISTDKLADSSVTASKLALNYISAISVNGRQVTTKGSRINIQSLGDLPVQYDSSSSTIFLGNALGDFIGNQPAPFPNTDDGTFGPSNPLSSNAVVGGESNEAWDKIGGGGMSDILGHDFVGGGYGNKAWGNYDAVAGGDTNLIYGDTSFIGGGQLNVIHANFSAVAGGESNEIDANYSFIGGGLTNRIAPLGQFGAIVSGQNNIDVGSWSIVGAGYNNKSPGFYSGILSGTTNRSGGVLTVIGGGNTNVISGDTSFIGGGMNNIIRSNSGAIAGGNSNVIDTLAPSSFIGGGESNLVHRPEGVVAGGFNNRDTGFAGFIGSGENNSIGDFTSFNVISGGTFNRQDDHTTSSTISGGVANRVSAEGGALLGGGENIIDTLSAFSAIGGGFENYIFDTMSVVAGGAFNINNSKFADISGGLNNKIVADADSFSNVAGGQNNYVHAHHSGISSGTNDSVISPFSVIAGGRGNIIEFARTTSGIGSGEGNDIKAELSVIAGGDSNKIVAPGPIATAESDLDFIGGGYKEQILNNSNSVIVGGDSNTIVGPGLHPDDDFNSFIGAGYHNTIESHKAVIVGGDTNTIGSNSDFSAVGGGSNNTIAATNAPYATIPGGDSLTANSFAQTVIGYNNVVSGTFVQGTQHLFGGGGITTQDLPLLIIGNGDNGANLSNAFEVSYDGHTTVYDQNGNTSTGRVPTYGASYNDNSIVAWGDITSGGAVNADFGISTISNPNPGVYVITISSNLPDAGGSNTFSFASITATLQESSMNPNAVTHNCGSITSTPIGTVSGTPNSFIIRTYDSSCDLTNRAFNFKVTAR